MCRYLGWKPLQAMNDAGIYNAVFEPQSVLLLEKNNVLMRAKTLGIGLQGKKFKFPDR